jgi:hypothetical protein
LWIEDKIENCFLGVSKPLLGSASAGALSRPLLFSRQNQTELPPETHTHTKMKISGRHFDFSVVDPVEIICWGTPVINDFAWDISKCVQN